MAFSVDQGEEAFIHGRGSCTSCSSSSFSSAEDPFIILQWKLGSGVRGGDSVGSGGLAPLFLKDIWGRRNASRAQPDKASLQTALRYWEDKDSDLTSK